MNGKASASAVVPAACCRELRRGRITQQPQRRAAGSLHGVESRVESPESRAELRSAMLHAEGNGVLESAETRLPYPFAPPWAVASVMCGSGLLLRVRSTCVTVAEPHTPCSPMPDELYSREIKGRTAA